MRWILEGTSRIADVDFILAQAEDPPAACPHDVEPVRRVGVRKAKVMADFMGERKVRSPIFKHDSSGTVAAADAADFPHRAVGVPVNYRHEEHIDIRGLNAVRSNRIAVRAQTLR